MPAHEHRIAVNGQSGGFSSANNRYIGRAPNEKAYAGSTQRQDPEPGCDCSCRWGSAARRPLSPHLTLNYCIALKASSRRGIDPFAHLRLAGWPSPSAIGLGSLPLAPYGEW